MPYFNNIHIQHLYYSYFKFKPKFIFGVHVILCWWFSCVDTNTNKSHRTTSRSDPQKSKFVKILSVSSEVPVPVAARPKA